MITAKFGGTSITARNLFHLKDIITPFHNCVVVSAVGKEHFGDVKTTDLLCQYYQTHLETYWQQIADKYRRLVEVNGISIDIEAVLSEAKSRALAHDLAYCASLGEELAAKVVAAYLGAIYIEAEQVVRFRNGKLHTRKTYSNAKKAFENVKLGVIGGFYGGTEGSRATFSRGGSDVTGAILAAALNATLYENWTDVNGVCVANPSAVAGVATISSMSYGEMQLLSRSGAEVLHPDAVAPVERKGIPIKIGNFLNPYAPSTIISNCRSDSKLLSITEKRVDGKVVTTILHAYSQWQVTAKIAEFLRCNVTTEYFFDKSVEVGDVAVYSVEFLPNIVRLTTDKSVLNSIYTVLTEKSVRQK